jgi:hypothetical protein
MNGRTVFKVALAVIVIAAVAGLVGLAFNAGVARGLVESGKLPAPVFLAPGEVEGGGVPAPYYHGQPWGWGYGFGFHRPFGPGWGLLGCLIPLGLLFLFFAIVRGIFWRGHMHWGHGWGPGPWAMGMRGWKPGEGPWGRGAPPFVEEWHRKMHEPQAEGTAEK